MGWGKPVRLDRDLLPNEMKYPVEGIIILQLDEPSLSECLSSIFCAADMYEPDESREEYELNDEMLKSKVTSLMQK